MNLLDMDNEKLEMLLIDYIDGKLTECERQQVEQELVRNENAFKLYEQLKEVIHAIDKSKKLEPSHDLKKQFDEFLADGDQGIEEDHQDHFLSTGILSCSRGSRVAGGRRWNWILDQQAK